MAKLVISHGPAKGTSFPLEEGGNLIGRWDPEVSSFPEIDLEDYDVESKISRKHAIIRNNQGTFTLEDLGSLNGTFLNNDERLKEGEVREVSIGDLIIIGKISLSLVGEE